MEILQISILVLLYFIPPILARNGRSKRISLGCLTILTLLLLIISYCRFGLTSRFGIAALSIVLLSAIVFTFTIGLFKRRKKGYKKLHRIADKSDSR
jgi:hypothetical protein